MISRTRLPITRGPENPRAARRRKPLASPPIFLLILLPAFLLSTPGCAKKQPPPPPGAPVHVAQSAEQDVPLEVQAVGNVEAYSTVQVKALVDGQMMEVRFKEGQDVRKDDVLFLIDTRPFEIALRQAEAVLARDQALLKNAEDDLARYGDLVAKDYVTKESYEQLKANAEMLRATVKGDAAAVDNARLELGYCTIRSPLDARTGAQLVKPGNLVKANDTSPLVVMTQIVPIYVTFSVPQQNLDLIRKFQAEDPLKTEALAGEESTPSTGVLTFVDNTVNTATGTITLKSTFPNEDRALWPGRYVNVSLTLTIEKARVVVPAQAVQTGQAGQYIMVVKPDMTVESRPIEVERQYKDLSVIRSGLKAGETVVTDGLLRLTPGAKVEILKPQEKTEKTS